ncbi:MAG: DUF5313 family protein [Gordonia sp. (in: high G+C Gram-positive bacteria)]|uniref:DUF5313 family protein n=1 Tax=Gordonia sp. (in: high G+C Gram-positive bacteria) TaxID=84139 RepID=UPI0039E6F664
MSRPNPLQWIAYSYGATLPDSKRDWVANDLMGRTAVIRHMIRMQFCFSPIYLILYFAFPGPWWIRALMVLLGASLALIFSVSYMDQNRARRLAKHGFGNDPHTYRQQAQQRARKEEYDAIYRAGRTDDADAA